MDNFTSPNTTTATPDEMGDVYPEPSPQEIELLKSITSKRYSQGDAGKLEAIEDLKEVFDELMSDNIMPKDDLQESFDTLKAAGDRLKKSRILPLTPGPPRAVKVVNSEPVFKQRPHPLAFDSVPNLSYFGEDSRPSSPESVTRNLSEAEAFEIVCRDLDLELQPKVSQADNDDDDEGLTNFDESEEVWKFDLQQLAKARSISTPRTPNPIRRVQDTLQLKYKQPIWPHHLNLQEIISRAGIVTILILDGSELTFLRDIGSSLPFLNTLSICKCGLRSLDGLQAVPSLRTLVATSNHITSVAQCSFLSQLGYLDLTDNPIEDASTFAFLNVCDRLRSIRLHFTPLSRREDFHYNMRRLLPQVKEIHPLGHVTGKRFDGGGGPKPNQFHHDMGKVFDRIMDEQITSGMPLRYSGSAQSVQDCKKNKETISSPLSAMTDTENDTSVLTTFPTLDKVDEGEEVDTNVEDGTHTDNLTTDCD